VERRCRVSTRCWRAAPTCEVKSGYGLTTESELKQLRAIRRLDAVHPLDLVPTFLGAHEIPPEFRQRRADYVSLVIDEMIPRVAADGLAEWCDVFCEAGVFTPDESVAILEAGRKAGLPGRVHADELGASGGSLVAARVVARSADHLIFCDDSGADALAVAGVCAVLLPTAAFYLKLGRFAPARMLRSQVAVALGTKTQRGYSPSMPFAMTSPAGMNMTLEESLVAATLNAAWSLERSDTVGSLEVGKLMDAVVVRGGLSEILRVGAPAVQTVIKRGTVVVG
jgi:imidazolonepropionase